MFPRHYFGGHYFAPRYFPGGTTTPPTPTTGADSVTITAVLTVRFQIARLPALVLHIRSVNTITLETEGS